MTTTLRVHREAPGIGFELRRGTFTVSLDGTAIGTIDWQGTLEVPIDPGRHVVKAEVGRYSSRPQTFDVAEQETASFRCHGAMLWPRFVLSLFVTNLAINLHEAKL
ncbi:MAG TPA: hypothetical protein VGG38_16715 [Acidimicrobiales bacterium]|jgi:hypothetical protein